MTAALLPPLILELRANAGKGVAELKGLSKAAVDAGQSASKPQAAFNKLAGIGKTLAIGLGGAAITIGGAALKMGMDYQEATTQLVTGAGESESNLDMVRKGMLALAPEVGQGPMALAQGMYLIESAGYHGAQGLTVLKAAAEAAKVGNADLKTVADGLTTAMTDYKIPTSQAATVTSQLVATVASGKTTMQDLSGSLHNVLPAAAAAHLGLSQVLGAMATMTGQGISADQASQDLGNVIRGLQNPTQQTTTEMEALGLNSTDVASRLGQRGLTGTLNLLVDAIARNTKGGLVFESTLKKSESAAADAKSELAALPANLKSLAEQYTNGTITSTQWRAALKGLTVEQKQLLQQYASTTDASRGFNSLLKSGTPQAQTFSAALAKLTGGATGMQVALALTGQNAATFSTNVAGISKTTAEAGGNVKGWSETSKDLSTQLDQAKAGIQAMGTQLGMALIPWVEKAIHLGVEWVGWLMKHRVVLYALAGVIGGVVVTAIGAYVAKLAWGAAETIGKLGTMVAGWAGIGPAADAAAAETEVAGETMQTAFGPVGLAIGAIVLAGTLLATHWKQVWGILKQVGQDVWNDGIKPVFNGIADAAKWLWNDALHPIFTVMMDVWKAEWDIAQDVYRDVILPVFHGISDTVSFLWDDVLKPTFAAIRDAWELQWDAVKAIYNDVIVPMLHGIENAFAVTRNVIRAVMNGISDAISFAWNGVIKPVFNVIKTVGIDPIEDAIRGLEIAWSFVWGLVTGAIQDAWNVLEPILNAIKTAVQDTIGAIGKVAGAVGGVVHGAGSIIGKGLSVLGLDTGGAVPGPIGAPVPAVVHGGEFMLSHDMLTGASSIPPSVVGAVLSNGLKSMPLTAPGSSALNSMSSPVQAEVPMQNGPAGQADGQGGLTVVVQGSIVDPQGLWNAVQKAALQHGARNPATWAPYRR